MNRPHRPLLKNPWLYAPRLEILEERLPPGDALLGMIIGTSAMGWDVLSATADSSGVPRPTARVTNTAAITLAVSPSIEAPVPGRESEASNPTNTGGLDEVSQPLALRHESRLGQVMADPLAGPLPERHASRARVARPSAPVAGNAATISSPTLVIAPDAGRAGPQPVSVGKELGQEMLPAVPVGEDSGVDGTVPPLPLFSKGTDGDYVAQIHQSIARVWGTGTKYWLANRWSGAQGSPRNLTWSFVPDGLSISNGIGEGVAPSETFSKLDSLFASQGGRPTWVNRFQQIFDRWEALTGIDYTRITFNGNDWDDGASWGSAGSTNRGDIRISMKPIDGGSGVLAYNYFPSNGDMVLDRSESWGSSANSHRFLRNTVAHENGHGFGVSHVCCNTHTMLMEPFLSTAVDGPQHDDIRAAQRHYGDPFEDNNSAAAATDIGTLTSGVPKSNTCNLPAPVSGSNPSSTSNCTIDADAEQDYFRFTVANASEVSLTVTPLGFSYNDNQQNANGTCQTGSTTNSLTKANLNVQLIDTNGSTVLATAASQGTGLSESLSNVVVPAGSYYLRVYEGDAPAQSQLYTFSVTAVATTAATHLGVSAPASTAAGTPVNITVTALNGNEQPDTGYVGTIHFTSTDSQALLPADYTYTPADQGVHVFSATLKAAGSQTVTATDIGNATITGNAVTQVNPVAAVSLQVAGFPSPTTAGDQHLVTVTARDPYGNAATGYTGTVNFTSSDSQATLPADYTFVPADAGVKSLPVTLETLGTQSITATDTVTGTITGTQSGIIVETAPTASFDVTGYPSTTTAGDQHQVTVTARDSNGDVATGYTGTVHFTSSDGQATLPADYTFILADAGIKSLTVTLKTTGTQSITATDTATGTITGTQSGISVNAATTASLDVSGYPSATTAGDEHGFTVTARDQYGNITTGYTGTVAFTSDDLQADLPANATLTNGTGTFDATLKTAGTQSLTATDTGNGTITGSQSGIGVDAAEAVTFDLTANTTVAAKGKPFIVTLIAFDAYQNVATGYVGTVHFTSSDANGVLPPDYPFLPDDQGVQGFFTTLNTLGSQSVTATDTLNGSLTDGLTIDVVRGDSTPANDEPTPPPTIVP